MTNPPPHPIWHQSPSPSPPQSLPANKCLSCSMEQLHLYKRLCKSRSRVQQGGIPIEERPRRKQVQFDVGEELGDEPMLPMDLTCFLAVGKGPEQDNAPSSPTPELGDLPQPDHSQPTYTGGARPKVPNRSSADWLQPRSKSRCREEPDPVNYPTGRLQQKCLGLVSTIPTV